MLIMRFHEILGVSEHSTIIEVQEAYDNRITKLEKSKDTISLEIYSNKKDEIRQAKIDCENWINDGAIQKLQKRIKESTHDYCNSNVLHSSVIGPCTVCDVYVAPKCCNDQDQLCCECCPCCTSGNDTYCNYCCGDCCGDDCGPCSSKVMPFELDILIYIIMIIGLIKFIYNKVSTSKKEAKQKKVEDAKTDNTQLITEKETAERKIIQLKDKLNETKKRKKQTDIFLNLFHSIEPSIDDNVVKSNELEYYNKVNRDIQKEENNLNLINKKIEENNRIIDQDK